MIVVHATAKLLRRVGPPTVEPTTASTSTRLGSWYATALFWKPQVAMFVNERTLLPLLMPLAPATSLLDRLPAWLEATLTAHRVPQGVIESELASATQIGVAKTASRSVLGVMNEFIRLAEWRKDEVTGKADLLALALDLSETPTSPLYQRHVSPDRELQALLCGPAKPPR